MRTKFRLVFCLVFLFSISLVLLGCIEEEKLNKLKNSEGYRLYSGKCNSCHNLIPPQEHSIEKFREYIERYGKGMTEDEKSKLEKFIEEAKK